MRVHQPELMSLTLTEWQFFCTFTFRRDRMPERVRLSMFFALLRTQALNFGVHFKRLMWVLRREQGESTGRYHFHALIAGCPPHTVMAPTCFRFEQIWRKLGGGHPKVSIYNPTLDGVDYILKNGDELARSLATRFAGDYHEITKFGGPCDLMLSESLMRHVVQRGLNGRWGRGETWPQRKRRLLGQTGHPATTQEVVTGSLFDATGLSQSPAPLCSINEKCQTLSSGTGGQITGP
jgi:hypothetical protein